MKKGVFNVFFLYTTFFLRVCIGQVSWSVWKWIAAVYVFMSYVEEIQIHTCSLCDPLFITRWYSFSQSMNFPRKCEAKLLLVMWRIKMSLCFQRKQLNEAEIDMCIGFGFPNVVVYIMTIVIKALFLYENIKILRLKMVSWLFLSTVFISSSNWSTEWEKVCVCENKQFYNLGRIWKRKFRGWEGWHGRAMHLVWHGVTASKKNLIKTWCYVLPFQAGALQKKTQL